MTGLSAVLGPSAYWYLARGTGVVSLLLLSASVVLGILGPLRWSGSARWPRFAVDFLHRDVSLLVMVVIVVHVITSVLDGFAPIRLVDAVLPVGGSYRPLWLGLGALAFDLLIALVVTSMVRRRLGYRAWRIVHWTAYASWPVAVLHGIGTGTDTKQWWMLLLTALCGVAVLSAIWTRIARAKDSAARTPALAMSIAAALGIGIFTLAGPLQRGWARRAGTPANLLSAAAGSGSSRSPGPSRFASSVAARGFSARLDGTVSQRPAVDGEIVDLSLRMHGGARGRLRVRLAGTPLSEGGLTMTGSQVDLAATGMRAAMQGRVLSLQGQEFLAHVSDSSGSGLDLRVDLNIDQATRSVRGTVAATPSSAQ